MLQSLKFVNLQTTEPTGEWLTNIRMNWYAQQAFAQESSAQESLAQLGVIYTGVICSGVFYTRVLSQQSSAQEYFA